MLNFEIDHKNSCSPGDWSDSLSISRPLSPIWSWDNWYLELTPGEQRHLQTTLSGRFPAATSLLASDRACYVVGYLSAPREYVDGLKGPEQHHFHSSLGVALTNDFQRFCVLSHDLFQALPEEGSIWSGSFARGRSVGGNASLPLFYFFYTRRNLLSEDVFAQQIAIATTTDFSEFTRSPVQITADPRWYETKTLLGDTSIHSFRDPFPFRIGNRAYMLVSAKSRFLPAGRLGEQGGENAVIAVYRATDELRLDRWEATSLAFATKTSEAEVASLYVDKGNNTHRFLFSCKSKDSYLRRTMGPGGEILCQSGEDGQLLTFEVSELERLLEAPPTSPLQVSPEVVRVSAPDGYAYRLIPSGVLLGFSTIRGRPLLAGRSPQLEGFTSVNQDFSDFKELR